MNSTDTQRVVVKVTRKHIMESRCGDTKKCAIAQALVDAGFRTAMVGSGALVTNGKKSFLKDSLESNPKYHEYQLAPYGTEAARTIVQFIDTFDKEVTAGDFKYDEKNDRYRSKSAAKKLAAAAERKRRKAIEPITLEFDVPVEELKALGFRKPSRSKKAASKRSR